MKTLGLIGGMSWESTALYYSALNRGVACRLGGLHSAKLLLANVDFEEIVGLQKAEKWDHAGKLLADVAARLVGAGAEGIALAVNTMHKVAHHIRDAIDAPFLDIRDAVARDLRTRGISKSGLLGTSYVIEGTFYGQHIEKAANCTIVRPERDQPDQLNAIIYGELSKGIIEDQSRTKVLAVIDELHRRGAQGVILGCTELPMLDLSNTSSIPLLDSTALHVEMCLDFMLEQQPRVGGE